MAPPQRNSNVSIVKNAELIDVDHEADMQRIVGTFIIFNCLPRLNHRVKINRLIIMNASTQNSLLNVKHEQSKVTVMTVLR